ncbi:baseplate assembly protein [Providencia rustigianii]|uniref:GPW/gp25 family protein n=1 Tax=Providencia rustigianii TaxID=158850 RepID=UPI000F6B8748|nr:GPW/gp25 family protein [Providencia rustigianii]MTC61018.1 baseplate assembly protein [Providencia rustigianii]VEH55433.1 Gene 25-like lysozyme [Providencia rustigianii]
MKYCGMNGKTGSNLTDSEHIRQSIADILRTPIGSRVMRRQYGSLLYDLIDQPQNPTLRLKIMSACYMALMQWEPRVRLQTIDYIRSDIGEMAVSLSGVIMPSGEPVSISIPVR